MKGFINSIGSKYVGVMGAGRSGISAACLLSNLGARVLISDAGFSGLSNSKWDIEWGGHTNKLLGTDMIVLSPSIRPNNRIVERAERNKLPVISELELAYRYTKGQLIAVTGTNGKTTTTTLISKMIKGAKSCGNIGTPLSAFAQREGKYIVEVSSFQLMYTDTFRPYISIILNIDVDHMDWHKDLNEYIYAKSKIFRNQRDGDYTILNADDTVVSRMARIVKGRKLFVSLHKEVQGAYKMHDMLFLNMDKKVELIKENELSLRGLHNQYNALFASLSAYVAGSDIRRIRTVLRTFKGLPHRIEYVDTIRGIDFYDDSKGTNPHAVLWALKSFRGDIILILGGDDKGLDFTSIKDEVAKKVNFIIAIGASKKKMRDVFGDIKPVYMAKTMQNAVEIAITQGKPGNTVLLSPGCASFDMYKNYKERGDDFANCVRRAKR